MQKSGVGETNSNNYDEKNFVVKKKLPKFALANRTTALWCNGSTSDSGSACEGSNPSKATLVPVL